MAGVWMSGQPRSKKFDPLSPNSKESFVLKSLFFPAAAAGDFCVCVHVCCRYAGGRSMDFLNKIGQQAEGIAGNVWNHCKSVYQEYS
jgi:hypothetical protein